jgi:hypothetical protein
MKTNMAASVLTVAAPGLSPAPLTVLLAGNQEEDCFLIREILSRSKDSFSAELDHATSLDEVKTMLQRKACGLVLFEYATKDAAAVELLSQFLNGGFSFSRPRMPTKERFAEIIGSGIWNCMGKWELN